MKLIPPRFPEEVRNSGEAAVYHELEINTDHGQMVAFHSLVVTEHAYKILGEIDFLLLDSRRLIVLEVKGGVVSCDSSGMWHYPYESKRESPYKQAKSAMFALKERLVQEFGESFVDRITFGFGVVFPGCDMPRQCTLECPSEATIDATGLSRDPGMTRFLRELIRYWDNKPGIDRRSGLEVDEVRNLNNFIKPIFSALPSLHAQADSAQRQIENLTAEQFRLLDFAKEFPRKICSGGAGTGKTFLAVELARREAFQGLRVALVCRSPLLAEFLRGLCPDYGISVLDFASLKQRSDTGTGMAFDSLILDEGQDLLSFDNLGVLEKCLEGGFQDGRWSLFLDPFNQAGVDGEFEPDALAFLQAYAPPALKLDRNCRNTQAILSSIKVATGLDLESSTIAGGPDVIYRKYADETEGAMLLAEGIENLLRGDVPPEDIVLLSPMALDASMARLLQPAILGKVFQIGKTGDLLPRAGTIPFCSIADFKGLERKFVFLLDLTPAHLEENRNLLYVGMSRSRIWLWVGMDPAFRKALGRAQGSNAAILARPEHP